MTAPEILDLLPNPEHLREVIGLLQKEGNPKPPTWNDWECNARILAVWAENLDELVDRLNENTCHKKKAIMHRNNCGG